MKKFILAMGTIFVFSGCASTWSKPGATQEDFANDKQYCALYAKVMNDNNTWSQGFTRASIQKQCMEERGWQRGPANQ